VSVRVIVTLAPATAAPVGSVTVPLMFPVDIVDWARRVEGISSSRIANAAMVRGNIWLREAFKRLIQFPFQVKDDVGLPVRPGRRRMSSFRRPTLSMCTSVSTANAAVGGYEIRLPCCRFP
jgi:hypothetical protein